MSQINFNNINIFQAYRSSFLLGTASTPIAEPSKIPERYRWSDDRISTDQVDMDVRHVRAYWLRGLFGR
jgi:hypothetical protein